MAVILPKQAGTPEGELLFQESDKITKLSEGVKIVNSLKETLNYYGGVGLAAPQIGISRKVFIVNLRPDGKILICRISGLKRILIQKSSVFLRKPMCMRKGV